MAALKIPVRAFLVDLGLNTVVPLACYREARARGASELAALVISGVYPLAASLFSLLRDRALNPFSPVVLIGLAVSAVALLLGGTPRLILLRESLPTLAVGLACLATLITRRPPDVLLRATHDRRQGPRKTGTVYRPLSAAGGHGDAPANHGSLGCCADA